MNSKQLRYSGSTGGCYIESKRQRSGAAHAATKSEELISSLVMKLRAPRHTFLLIAFLIGLLVEAHAQVQEKTLFGDALGNLDIEGVRAALKAGADPNERYDRRGLSAIGRVATAVMSAGYRDSPVPLNEAEAKAISILDVLFEAGAQIRNYDIEILHAPVIEGAEKLTKYLLDRGANPNGADHSGNTPVILGTKYGHPDIVKLLIEYGAKPLDAVTSAQIRFIAAAGNGDLIAVRRELNNGAQINRRGPTKETALIEAVSSQQYSAVRQLLELGANPNLPGEQFGVPTSPLHQAVFRNKLKFEKGNAGEIVKLLLKAGAHVSSTDFFKQQTPLHVAAYVNNPIAVKMLLEAGAKVMPKDADGKTPLDYAESAEVIKLLKSYGAKESP
jgi:ankyrin repeat protein